MVESSHLFQRVASFLHLFMEFSREVEKNLFSSLSESGFIPTETVDSRFPDGPGVVLISFREWLHSYDLGCSSQVRQKSSSSHLFQRVASFLHWKQSII